MKCSVPDCRNYQKRVNKAHGITYHTFPRNPVMRTLWTKALGLGDRQPKNRHVVCSQHFKKDNFYVNKAGWLRLKADAVPRIKPCKDVKSPSFKFRSPNQSSIKPTVELMCRICLCKDREIYDLEKCNIKKYYELLTVTEISKEDELPKQVCWECKARLYSFARLRGVAQQSLTLLQTFYNTVKSDLEAQSFNIDREANNLTSTLTKHVFECDHADYHFINEELSLLIVNIPDIKNENYINDKNDGPSEPDIKIEVVNIDTVFDDKNDHHNFDDTKFDDENVDDTKFDDENDQDVDDLRNEELEVDNNDINDLDFDDNDGFSSSDDDLLINTKNKKDNKNQVKTVRQDEKADWEEFFDIKLLSIEEKMLSVQSRKESSNYKNSEYKCEFCFKGFAVEGTYQRHLIKHSEASGRYQCEYCKFRFKSSKAMQGHRRALHSKQYKCKQCDYVTLAPATAILHERYHNGKRYKCSHCEMEFMKLTTYMSHIRIKHSSDFVCKLCGCSFVSAKGLTQHLNLKHYEVQQEVPEDGPICSECNIQFINEEALNTHYQKSTKHNVNRVSKRGTMRAPIPRDIKKKKNKKKSTQVLKPENCTKLKTPINCEQCDMQLADFKKYSHHFRTYHPEKNRTLYPNHMKSMCDICGKILPCLTYLYEHNLTHKGDKQFSCSQCGKSFSNTMRLKLHEQIHLKRKFPCEVCFKKFSTKGNVTKHMVIHMGIKFECEICGKSFNHSEHKKAHIDFVHLKKPWPKRNRVSRTKRKITEENTEELDKIYIQEVVQIETSSLSLEDLSNIDDNSTHFVEDTTTSV